MPKVKIDIAELEVEGVPVSYLDEGEVFIWDGDFIGLRVLDGAIVMSMNYTELDGNEVYIYSESELTDLDPVISRPDLRARIVFERINGRN